MPKSIEYLFQICYIQNRQFFNKIRATDELQELYDIPQLGLITKDDEGKSFLVDRWIHSLVNRNKRRFTREQSLDLAAAAVKLSAEKCGQDAVCFIGCDLNAGADEVCRILKGKLEKENIGVRILNNVLYDAEAMEELGSVRCVVLAETAGSTLYDEIARELELTSRQGIRILGGIIVE